jgi:hypothetical protein
MKKLPKNCLVITDPIYCQDFVFVLNRSHNKFRDIMKKYLNIDIKEAEYNCSGEFYSFQNKDQCPLAVIWVSGKHTIVHEIFHATAWLMRNRDITLDSEGAEESWAYHISFLYREIMDGLK